MKNLRFTIIFLFFLYLCHPNLLAQKNLGLEGSLNFRELGGIKIQDSLEIKPNMLFRSGTISRLSQSDLSKFAETKIETVIDLRSQFEIEKDPDHYPESLQIKRIHSPIGSIGEEGMLAFMTALKDPNFDEKKADQLMIMANKNMVANIKDFGSIIERMKNGERILFHCSAGKDRTGLAGAIVLHILGADMATIFEDFLRSNENRLKAKENSDNTFGIPSEKIALLSGVKSSYLEAALFEIEHKYGSMDNMLLEEFGLDELTKSKIRRHYLQ